MVLSAAAVLLCSKVTRLQAVTELMATSDLPNTLQGDALHKLLQDALIREDVQRSQPVAHPISLAGWLKHVKYTFCTSQARKDYLRNDAGGCIELGA